MTKIKCALCDGDADELGRDEMFVQIGRTVRTLPGSIRILNCPNCGLREQLDEVPLQNSSNNPDAMAGCQAATPQSIPLM
jgi:hypothetical protein